MASVSLVGSVEFARVEAMALEVGEAWAEAGLGSARALSSHSSISSLPSTACPPAHRRGVYNRIVKAFKRWSEAKQKIIEQESESKA